MAGFAVVADEVRALANRTQEATVEIDRVVVQLTEQCNLVVEDMAKGSSLSNSSRKQSHEVEQLLQQIGLCPVQAGTGPRVRTGPQ